MLKGRVHSDAKTDVWICCDMRYLKSNDIMKFCDVIASSIT